jgi:predicted Ser/Thr protein kinase
MTVAARGATLTCMSVRRTDVRVLTVILIAIVGVSAIGWIALAQFPSDGVRLDTPPDVREREQRTTIVVQPGSPAEKAGMHSGDTVFRIDGIDVFETAKLRAHFRSPVGTRLVTRYIKYTPHGPARIAVRRQPAGAFIPYRASLLLNLLMAIPYAIVGMYTHWKRPGDARARLLNVFCILFVAVCIAPKELLFAIGETAEFFGIAFVAVVLAIVPPLLVHFALRFPRDVFFLRRHRYVVPLLYAIPAAEFGYAIFAGDHWFLGPASIITFLAYLIAAPVLLFARYRGGSSEEKRQIRWPLWGLFVATAGTVVWSLVFNSVLFAPPGHRSVLIGVNPLAFVVVPITIAIAIFKYRLFDIDVVIRRTATYTLVMTIVLTLNFAAIGLLGRLLATTGGGSQNATVLATVFVAAAFAPIRGGVQRRVNRYFSRGRVEEPEALRQMHVVIDAAPTLPVLYENAAAKLQQIFNSRTVVVFDFGPAADTATAGAAVGVSEELAAALALRADSAATRAVVNLDREDVAIEGSDGAAFARSRARLVAPCRWHDELLAVITIGPRISDARYDTSDERIIAAVATQLALAIENHRLRERNALEAEWHALDRTTRLVFVAASSIDGAPAADMPELVARTAAVMEDEGASLAPENIAAAVERLLQSGAIDIDRGVLRIVRRSWRNAADFRRPLRELASELRRRIGAYEIVERIGGGGMGEVFRAVNVHDGSIAALKLLPPGTRSNESRRRLEREGAIVSALAHPNVVRMLARGEHDGQMYIAMELIEGETLASRMLRDGWTARDAIDVALQISAALAALHAAGVVHRDLKPSNIMLTPAGRAVLLDFGLARDVASQTITGSSQIMGSLPYMSPEQLEGTRVDARSDVWSFSVVVYEMLLRRRPWRASEPARMAIEIASERADCAALQHVANAALLALVREGLEPHVELRIRDGAELHRRLLHADAVVARPTVDAETDADAPTLTAVARFDVP